MSEVAAHAGHMPPPALLPPQAEPPSGPEKVVEWKTSSAVSLVYVLK